MRSIPLSSCSLAAAALAAVALVAGCDTRATASNAGAVAPERLSTELESCAATADCAVGLRCFDLTCVRDARSALGDYLAARAARAASVDDAVRDYAEALAVYESEKLAVPVDLDCAYGRALAGAKAKPDKAELAARVLHRCLLATPIGSSLRRDTLAALVGLDDVGLDPKQIAKPALADLYLTRAPARPSTDALTVTVTADPVVAAKTFPLVIERLTAADLRGPLIACWDKHNASGALVARFPLKVTYKPSEFDDEPGVYKVVLDPVTDAAASCVQAVAAAALPATKGVKDKIDTTLVVTIK